jgi:hypothetical protein
MAIRRRARKPKGMRKVSYELISPDSTVGEPVYRLLRELVGAHHEHLKDARIALAWCTSWRPDVDGRVTLGKCRRASDLDRELALVRFHHPAQENLLAGPRRQRGPAARAPRSRALSRGRDLRPAHRRAGVRRARAKGVPDSPPRPGGVLGDRGALRVLEGRHRALLRRVESVRSRTMAAVRELPGVRQPGLGDAGGRVGGPLSVLGDLARTAHRGARLVKWLR